MTEFLPTSSLMKISDNSESENTNSDLPVLPSNINEPTTKQGKIDSIMSVA